MPKYFKKKVSVYTKTYIEISEKLKQEKLVIKDKIHYQNQDTGKVRIYRVQEASGMIGTAQTAVEISLGLIGIS